jgi:hypothetical protein
MPFRERREGGGAWARITRARPISVVVADQRGTRAIASGKSPQITAYGNPHRHLRRAHPPTADGHNIDSAHRLAGAGGLNFLFACDKGRTL